MSVEKETSGAVGPTRRQRLLNILNSFGHNAVRFNAQQLLYRALNDMSQIPDDLLEMLTKEIVSEWRFSQRMARKNRTRRSA